MKVVVLVEDNFSIRENTAGNLELERYKVITAINGREALEMIPEKIPDIILCDVSTPELNGFQLLINLKEHNGYRHMPFVFLTASAEKK